MGHGGRDSSFSGGRECFLQSNLCDYFPVYFSHKLRAIVI